MKDLKEENWGLKQMYAELNLGHQVAKLIIKKGVRPSDKRELVEWSSKEETPVSEGVQTTTTPEIFLVLQINKGDAEVICKLQYYA